MGLAKIATWMVMIGASLGTGSSAAADFDQDNPRIAYQALVTDSRLQEISGLVVSRRHADVIWVHNDGGNNPELYALDARGQVLATLKVETENQDWEDLALVEQGEHSLLLIADTGDNGGLRQDLRIIAVEEPSTLHDGSSKPVWIQEFRWPDGPRDCEAMAVDNQRKEILLISKKRVPPELFRLPLPSGPSKEVVTARRLGLLNGIGQPDAEDLRRNPVFGRYRAQVSGADVSSDGLTLAVLNYRQVLVFNRLGNESWKKALRRPARAFAYPWLPQAEAIGFLPDGHSLLIGSEKVPTPILRLRVDD